MFSPNYSLRIAFGSNAVFSILCALPMTLAAGKLAQLMGVAPNILFWVGLVVGINALFLAAYALLEQIPRSLAETAVAGDALWVVASVIILALGPPALTYWGHVLIIDVAVVVGILGAAQYYHLHNDGLP